MPAVMQEGPSPAAREGTQVPRAISCERCAPVSICGDDQVKKLDEIMEATGRLFWEAKKASTTPR